MSEICDSIYCAIRLNKNLDCNHICNKIGKLLEELKQHNSSIPEYVMTIRINKSVESNIIHKRIESK